jgi:hypothetical protein
MTQLLTDAQLLECADINLNSVLGEENTPEAVAASVLSSIAASLLVIARHAADGETR